jgi:STAS-like domain of unknown function (DUF4325)
MTDLKLSIANDFSRYPAGRTRRDGEFSAQRFREEKLVPALKKAQTIGGRVIVVLDGVYGYSSSFLEETFGGLVRSKLFPAAWLRKALLIEASDPIYTSYKLDAESYLQDELNYAA